jgi:hypothetical protein
MAVANKSMECRAVAVRRRLRGVSLSGAAVVFSLIFGYAAVLCGCRTGTKNMSPDWSKNREALERTEGVAGMEPGSEAEKASLRRFDEFYQEYSTASITSGVRAVYAEDGWFGDPFHVVQGIDAIEHYFLAMAEPVEECVFKVVKGSRRFFHHFAASRIGPPSFASILFMSFFDLLPISRRAV